MRVWPRRLVLSLAFVLAPAAGVRAQPQVEIVLDVSGSMLEPLGPTDPRSKISLARAAVIELAGQLPSSADVALTFYGHKPDPNARCDNIGNVVAFGPRDVGAIVYQVVNAQPFGFTPITRALQDAAGRLRKRSGGPRRVILVSDGLETPECGRDPCGAVRKLRESGAELTFHVVGVGVNKQAREQLACIATAGGGRYFNVERSRDFDSAVGWLGRATGGFMDTATLVAMFGFLALMVERVTNAVAILLTYVPWWRAHMEPSTTASPEERTLVERNRRVALFAISAVLAIAGALIAKVNLIATLDRVSVSVPATAGMVLTGLAIAAGAEPIRDLLKGREGRRDDAKDQTRPIQLTGTLIVQQTLPEPARPDAVPLPRA